MRPIPSLIAVLLAFGSAGALAQNTAAPQPPTGKPVSDSASYGPVLNPQDSPATRQRAGEARPQAQEERAGQPPVTGKQDEADPSARPAPQPPAQPQTQPQTQQERQGRPEARPADKRGKQAQRRPGAVQRVESTPRIAAPAPIPFPPTTTTAPAAPAPLVPQTSQAVGCAGSLCTDASGATYNAGNGNVGVSSSGRLCTRNGANIQCI